MISLPVLEKLSIPLAIAGGVGIFACYLNQSDSTLDSGAWSNLQSSMDSFLNSVDIDTRLEQKVNQLKSDSNDLPTGLKMAKHFSEDNTEGDNSRLAKNWVKLFCEEEKGKHQINKQEQQFIQSYCI